MKVLILGLPASGKTTLAKKISRDLGVHHVESDAFFRGEDGVAREQDEFVRHVLPELERDAFVVEGHFKFLRQHLIGVVDHVIWIENDRSKLMWRMIFRGIFRGPQAWVREIESIRFVLSNRKKLLGFQKTALGEFAKTNVPVLRFDPFTQPFDKVRDFLSVKSVAAVAE